MLGVLLKKPALPDAARNKPVMAGIQESFHPLAVGLDDWLELRLAAGGERYIVTLQIYMQSRQRCGGKR